MSKKTLIWVAYDTSKTDESCVTCVEPNNGMAKMLVGYFGSDADEVYKIVSEQGYLAEHDQAIKDKIIAQFEREIASLNRAELTEQNLARFVFRIREIIENQKGEQA